MGVVYRAEDLKLNRDVALTFLAESLTRDLLAVDLFEQEARAAAINHPHICTTTVARPESRRLVHELYFKTGKISLVEGTEGMFFPGRRTGDTSLGWRAPNRR